MAEYEIKKIKSPHLPPNTPYPEIFVCFDQKGNPTGIMCDDFKENNELPCRGTHQCTYEKWKKI